MVERWYYASSSTGTAKKLKTAHQKFYGWIKSDEAKKIVESPLVRKSGFEIQEIFACEMWNPPSGVLESGIQLKESGILGFGIRKTA